MESSVFNQITKRQYLDRYYVTTETDPFFTKLSRGRLGFSQISVTTIVTANGIQMKTEPTSINRRNRTMEFYDDDDE